MLRGSETMNKEPLDADVIIVGAGPFGLVLAHELGRRNIRTILFNDRESTTPHPQAGATQARTMEHYRRLGFADRIRAAGLPADYPTDVAYFTRFTGHEMSRLELPSSGEAAALARDPAISAHAAELPHRLSQMFVEQILREEAEPLASLDMRFGWRVTGFVENDEHVAVQTEAPDSAAATFTARYLVGADGGRSGIRRQLGINYQGVRDTDRPFLAGQMYATFFRAPAVYDIIPHRLAWQYWAINAESRGMMLSTDGVGGFVYMTQLRPGDDPATMTDDRIKALIYGAMGHEFLLEIIARSPWTAGLSLVAERFQAGRVFLGGDAVHLFTPTGGLGYNTAVEDAVNLGWKLAATLSGWGGPQLFDSYEVEREPVARRNTAYARAFAESLGRFSVPPEIEEDSAAGIAARADIGTYLLNHARAEFNIPGVTLGARYDGSPIIVTDGTQPPPDSPSDYQQTACPGGRAPHAWLSDGRSLYDALGFEFNLLRLGDADIEPFVTAARARGVPLTVVDLTDENLSGLYEAKLALLRPDQIVCWRGTSAPSDIDAMFATVTGSGLTSKTQDAVQ
jgi:2-polyprenyl-6-methoxyphenol hydroxylase-like FAD-dependent oxidoreductase